MKTNMHYILSCFIAYMALQLTFTSAQAQLKVLSGGNVGINTSSPELKAHITGTGGNFASSGTSQTGILRLQGAGSNPVLDFGSNGATACMMQSTDRTDLSVEYNLALNPNGGNVGVGSSIPQRKFVVSASGEGVEIHQFTGYGQLIAYNRTLSAYRPLVLQDAAGGNVGIGVTAPGSKLDVNGTSNFTGNMSITGNVTVVGNGTYTGSWTMSDAAFKTDIDSLENALLIIQQLKPKTYYFDTVGFSDFNFGSKKQYGFIAQELETVLPELVRSSTKNAVLDSTGAVVYPSKTFKAVNYTELIGILTKGIQELNTALQAQEETIGELQSQVASCCSSQQGIGTAGNGGNIQEQGTGQYQGTAYGNGIDDAQTGTSPVLFQNVPNPFSQQTSISYFIPAKFQSASIMVFDLNGKLMTTLPVTSQGKGAITINGSQLNPGMFVYSLIIDGKIIDTKRMILTQ